MIPEDAWPAGDLIEWWDDETRTQHDLSDLETDVTRPFTAEENAAADERAAAAQEAANGRTLRQQAAAGLAANRVFLDLTAPTNAQTLAQVKALTRQMNNLIRLAVDDLTGTDFARPSTKTSVAGVMAADKA